MSTFAAPGPGAARRTAPVVFASAVLGATALIATVDPDRPGHYPVCPFHATTGLWCPGCGSLRAVHALTRGDLTAAVHRNVLLVAAVPFALAAWVAWFRGPRPAVPFRVRPVHGFALVALVLTFAVLRNLPAFAFLAPTRS